MPELYGKWKMIWRGREPPGNRGRCPSLPCHEISLVTLKCLARFDGTYRRINRVLWCLLCALQLLKYCGARVIGVAGGTKKAQYLMEELKCDGVIDYKDTKNRKLHEQIEALCPDGIDFIYDNVGGTILDALLYRINPKGRVVICGAISQYSGKLNTENKETGGQSKVEGPSNYLKLAERGAEMKGFNVMQYMMKLPLMVIGMYYLYLRGYVTVQEHIEDGLEQFPYALQKLFTGETIGKTLVKLN